MDILLDTQILIWSFDISSPLSNQHKNLLEDESNTIYVSQISLMELAIKKNIKKLPDFIPDIVIVAQQSLKLGFKLFTLSNEQIFTYQNLPLFDGHKDPFDRFLVAVARQQKLSVLTTDRKFQLYNSLIEVI